MITLVVAADSKNGIGKNNEMPWHMPADLRHFRRVTTGHPIVMGSKTYKAIGKALPGRTNIVVTRNSNWFEEGILIVNSLKEALKHAKKIDENVMVIGGGEIFKQTLPLADAVEFTRIEADVQADTFFPELPEGEWEMVSEECHDADDKNPYRYCFQRYERTAAEKA